MQTIAQQLKVTKFPFKIKDSKGNEIYSEDSNGYWSKRKYDSDGNLIYFEDSTGFWSKIEYDSKGNRIYFENSDGYWSKRKYDSDGNLIYYEDSTGYILDNRPKNVELALEEIAKKFGIPVENVRIKD